MGTDGTGETGMVSEENRSYAPLFLKEIHFRGNSSLVPLYQLVNIYIPHRIDPYLTLEHGALSQSPPYRN